jgi:hypothetical protein
LVPIQTPGAGCITRREQFLPVKRFLFAGDAAPILFFQFSGIGCIESFEITVLIGLLFTGFEGEEGTVGMVPADIGDTAPE